MLDDAARPCRDAAYAALVEAAARSVAVQASTLLEPD
jgi:hypothetical protein